MGHQSRYACRTCNFSFLIVSFEQIVYIKPPWNLRDVLQCLKKHWAAVFGHVVPRRKLQTVLNLIDFFKSGMCFHSFTESKYIFHTFKQSSIPFISGYFHFFPHIKKHIQKKNNIWSQLQVLLQLEFPSWSVEPQDRNSFAKHISKKNI